MIGETIGNFRVIGKLGAGGMGEVYLAEQRSIETKVAIKVLRPEISVDRAHVDRFFNEARAVSKIRHAGTVKIFDVGFHTTGHAYLVMEFLEGETLSGRVARGALRLAQLGDIGRQTAGVLEATHSAGITHRDLKPDNIFLVPDAELASGERVKILDFGIAKLTGATAAGKPQTVGTMGTPAYMAPEQWGDSGNVDARADIYSLGCVLFEMATRRTPFVSTTFAAACAAHLSQPPPKLRTLVPAVPASLEALIDAMLAKTPDARPPLREVTRVLHELAMSPDAALIAAPPAVATPVAPTVAPDAPTYGSAIHQVTPADNPSTPAPPAPPSVPPVAAPSPPSVPPPVVAPAPSSQPTTLSGAASTSTPAPARSSRAPLYAIAGVVAVGGIIAFAVTRGGGGSGGGPGSGDGSTVASATPDAEVATPTSDAPAASPDVAVAEVPAPRTWTRPRFVEIAGAQVMPVQATRAQYQDYLSSLPAAERGAQTPLDDWSADRPDEPVGWVTFEQATAFCRAADAALLTKVQWLAAARGTWRIGAALPGELVFRDWTATVSDGLALVLGGTSKMANDAERMRAVTNPLSKSIDPAGTPAARASATIGIRCIRGDVVARPAPEKPACDRASCALINYTGACCEKFRPEPPKPRIPQVTVGQLDVRGRIPPSGLHDTLAKSGLLRACYKRVLSNNPTIAGRMTIEWVVDPEGRGVSVKASGVEPPLEGCIADAVRRIRFPKPEGGIAQVKGVLTFSPG